LKTPTVRANTSKPTVLVFAGPNGSGKTTVTKNLPCCGTYVNADDLKREYSLTDIEAARGAEALRNRLVEKKSNFTFETVLSTERNLLLLQKAKQNGYRVECVYVLTCDAGINVARVQGRVREGGHDVPEGKIRSRYSKALKLLPRLLDVCDRMLVYDNSLERAFLIFEKTRKGGVFFPNATWPVEKLEALLFT